MFTFCGFPRAEKQRRLGQLNGMSIDLRPGSAVDQFAPRSCGSRTLGGRLPLLAGLLPRWRRLRGASEAIDSTHARGLRRAPRTGHRRVLYLSRSELPARLHQVRAQELLNSSEDLRPIEVFREGIHSAPPNDLRVERILGVTLLNPEETRTGSLMFGVGVNSDSGPASLPTISYPDRAGRVSKGAEAMFYDRPIYSGDARLFYDLTASAPGMNTSRADVLAVIEAEAKQEPAVRPGRIDPAAQRLFRQAASVGWKTVTWAEDRGQPEWTITFTGDGQYVAERTLPPGLRERIVCDGRTLLHLYPDLGIGARRTVSRFHRFDFLRMVPWALPPAEDLAHDADPRCRGRADRGAGAARSGSGP